MKNIECDVCGSIKARKNMLMHTNTPTCKRRANIIRYEKLYGSTYICMYKHIANGDIDFEGVIKMEEQETKNIIVFNHILSILLLNFLLEE